MSSAEVIAPGFRMRRAPRAPLLLLLGSLALYIGVAIATGQTRMLEVVGMVGLLQRMVALGIVAIGQTFVILAGSIDLSVANLISVAAVLASFIMQGRPEMMFVAVVAVLAVSAIVGLILPGCSFLRLLGQARVAWMERCSTLRGSRIRKRESESSIWPSRMRSFTRIIT